MENTFDRQGVGVDRWQIGRQLFVDRAVLVRPTGPLGSVGKGPFRYSFWRLVAFLFLSLGALLTTMFLSNI
jgi:hypothetical protein